jgi:hypothetical protein
MNGRSTVAYLATMLLRGRGIVAVATASMDARTAEMEREHRGRATAALFGRPLRICFVIYNQPSPFISPLLSHNE